MNYVRIRHSSPTVQLSFNAGLSFHRRASLNIKRFSKCSILFIFGDIKDLPSHLETVLHSYEKLVNLKIVFVLYSGESDIEGKLSNLIANPMDDTVLIHMDEFEKERQTPRVTK